MGWLKHISDSATKTSVVKVVPKVTSNDIDSSSSLLRSIERSDILDCNLFVVVEKSKLLFLSVDLYSEGHRSVLVRRPTLENHWALDDVGVYRQRLDSLTVKEALDILVGFSESLTSDLNVLSGCISWPALWEGAKNVVEVKIKASLSVVVTVKGQINFDGVASVPSRGRSTFHGFLVDVVGRYVLCGSVLIFPGLVLFGIGKLTESAPDRLEAVSDVGEFGALKPDFGTSVDAARPWRDVDNFRLLVVAKGKSSLCEVNPVQRNCDLEGSSSLFHSRRLANNSVGLDEFGLNNFVSDSAEWEHAIFGFKVEPGSSQLDVSAS